MHGRQGRHGRSTRWDRGWRRSAAAASCSSGSSSINQRQWHSTASASSPPTCTTSSHSVRTNLPASHSSSFVFPPPVRCPDQSLTPVAGSLRAVAGMESPRAVVPSSSALAAAPPAHDAVAAVPGELDDLLLVRDAPRVKTNTMTKLVATRQPQPILPVPPLNLLCPLH